MAIKSAPKVAIIGAGVAGLNCARILNENSIDCLVYDKGRFLGGRLATRTRDQNQFDYGAQYFTAQNKSFQSFIDEGIDKGAIAIWQGRFGKLTNGKIEKQSFNYNRYVGTPAMNSLASLLASGLNFNLRHRVTNVEHNNNKWKLSGIDSTKVETKDFQSEEFDFLVLNTPPQQAKSLVPNSLLDDVQIEPCIAHGLSFDSELNLDLDAIQIEDSKLAWVARDSSKPGRPHGERWMLHGSPKWSKEIYELDSSALEKLTIDTFKNLFDLDLPAITFVKQHRWRYALPVKPIESGYILQDDLQVAYCGDWCFGAKVEAAYLSGQMLAKELLKKF